MQGREGSHDSRAPFVGLFLRGVVEQASQVQDAQERFAVGHGSAVHETAVVAGERGDRGLFTFALVVFRVVVHGEFVDHRGDVPPAFEFRPGELGLAEPGVRRIQVREVGGAQAYPAVASVGEGGGEQASVGFVGGRAPVFAEQGRFAGHR